MLGEMWRKVMNWLATIAGLMQALILGLFGGVPAKTTQTRPAPVVEAAPPSDALDEWQRVERAPPFRPRCHRLGDKAYIDALRARQDNYWEAVGLPCGLAASAPRPAPSQSRGVAA